MRLAGRIAVVTGGDRGIGRSIALALAREGATVALANRDQARAHEVVRAIEGAGGNAFAVPTDVSRLADIHRLVRTVRERCGRIDVLVNNAGLGAGRPPLELSEEDWDRLMAVNLKGTFFCCQTVGRVMLEQGGGKIVNITSICAEIGWPGLAHYCASKAGVKLLTQSFAVELAPSVQVNAVGPGTVETDINRNILAAPSERQWRLDRIPLKRLGEPQDIAEAVVFLASEASSYITGQSIYVDGGRLASGGTPWSALPAKPVDKT